jgi:hypothetical protein
VATPAHDEPRSTKRWRLTRAWPRGRSGDLDQRPRGSGGKTEHRGLDGPLSGGRVAVRQSDDGGKVALGRKLGGGGARARRREEESRDWCDGDWVRPQTFIGGGGRWRRPRKAGQRQ